MDGGAGRSFQVLLWNARPSVTSDVLFLQIFRFVHFIGLQYNKTNLNLEIHADMTLNENKCLEFDYPMRKKVLRFLPPIFKCLLKPTASL